MARRGTKDEIGRKKSKEKEGTEGYFKEEGEEGEKRVTAKVREVRQEDITTER